MRKSSKKAANVSSNVPAVIENAAAAELVTVSADEIATGVTLDNATGETIINPNPEATATATEAKPDPRAERAARIAADRDAVNALYARFELNRLSVPVKPLSAFKLAASSAHPVARGVSQRQCAAIAVAFAAAGVKLAAGASAARVFEIDGKPSAIENGVIRDAISSGLITVSGETPESEMLTLTKNAAVAISGQLGASLLKAAKLA